MREPGYLLKRFVCPVLQVRGCGSFWRRKTAAAVFGTAAAFSILWCCICGFPLTIFNRLPAKVSLRVMRGRVALPRFFCEISRGGPHGRCGFCGDAMKKELPRILIAGTNSGCGKTTFVSGLLTALNDQMPILYCSVTDKTKEKLAGAFITYLSTNSEDVSQ